MTTTGDTAPEVDYRQSGEQPAPPLPQPPGMLEQLAHLERTAVDLGLPHVVARIQQLRLVLRWVAVARRNGETAGAGAAAVARGEARPCPDTTSQQDH